MNPASLVALLSGDLSNAIVAATPGGIEQQEKQGQITESFRETLPIEGTDGKDERQTWEALGFVFGDKEDIFVNAKFPKGWRKSPTDHSMWTDILDDKDRKRGAIFYKAAFYDRSAHCRLTLRFGITSDYADPEETVSVLDACGEVTRSIAGLKRPNWHEDRVEGERRAQLKDAAKAELRAWLDENYPDWKSPLAYWL